MTKTKRVSRRVRSSSTSTPSVIDYTKPGVWHAMNQPVVEVSEGFARNLLGVAVVLLAVAWVGPHWQNASASVDVGMYSSPLVTGVRMDHRLSASDTAVGVSGSRVAGARIVGAPTWYGLFDDLPQDVSVAFAKAANQVLDVSDSASAVADFYQPGASEVWQAWLELMADP